LLKPFPFRDPNRLVVMRETVEDEASHERSPVPDEGWQTFFAREPAVIGRTLRIEGHPVTVIGVLPSRMRFEQQGVARRFLKGDLGRQCDLRKPLAPRERDLNADMDNFNDKAIARLKPGVTLSQARAELDTMQTAYTRSAHLPLHFGIALTPLAKDLGLV
jgi:hypothetical protein